MTVLCKLFNNKQINETNERATKVTVNQSLWTAESAVFAGPVEAKSTALDH